MKNMFIYLFVFLFSAKAYADQKSEKRYLGMPSPPADQPVIFAEGIVSKKGTIEEKIAFSDDGKEVFFGRHLDHSKENYTKPMLMYAKLEKDVWSSPVVAHLSKGKNVGWPMTSLDGNILFMEEHEGKIVSSKKINGQWSALEYITPDIKASQGFGLAQLTDDNVFYFHDRYDRIAYSSKIINGKYTKPKPLSYMINPSTEFFVSRKNDYIIFMPINWSNQFHISFKDENNEWDMPIPFTTYFNRDKWNGWGVGPHVTSDNKYLFFGKGNDIYWVKADFIEVLRKYKRPY